MVKSLVALGWLRDCVIIVLLLAGNHIRHSSPPIGITIIIGALIVLSERFLWSWYLCDLKDAEKQRQDSAQT
jgi:hypothetical protein